VRPSGEVANGETVSIPNSSVRRCSKAIATRRSPRANSSPANDRGRQSNKQIATVLELSANTVAVHRANMMDALGIHRTAELVVYAIRNGLVDLP